MQKDLITQLVQDVREEVVALRRHLHAHPELSFKEFQTALFIQETLTSWEIPWKTIAGTGVLVEIKGLAGASDRCIALRADMDALPILEQSGLAYASQNEGVMHACGHDFHTANLLGVCKILQGLRNQFSGSILFVFQPAEEKIPGGASAVLKDPIFAAYKDRISAMLGLHVSPKLASGKLAVCSGRFMASSDELYIRIKGRGGHAAEPHMLIDPVAISAQLITTLQQLVSRYADPKIPSVLSFGKVIANGAANIIPDEVYIEGTFRTLDEAWRSKALERIEATIRQLPQILGATVDLELRRGYPSLYNNEELAALFTELIGHTEGEAALEKCSIWMAAEDFAYYSQSFPSLFYLVGIYNKEKDCVSGLHTASFRLDEDAFAIAMRSMIHAALALLKSV